MGFFGTGMMVEHLKHERTLHSSSNLLKSFVKMGTSWSAQVLRQAGDTLSGSGAFLLVFFLKTWCTSTSLIFSTGVGERGVAGGVNGHVERCSGRVWGVSWPIRADCACRKKGLYRKRGLSFQRAHTSLSASVLFHERLKGAVLSAFS